MDSLKDQFAKIYEQNLDKIYRFVYLKVSSQESAEDITSKVFLKFWESFKSQQGAIKNPSAFLYQMARNAVIDYYRAKDRSKLVAIDSAPELIDEKSDSHQMAVLSADIEAVKVGIAKLKQEYQDVIILHYLEDKSVKEVAELLDKPEGTIRVMIHRGLSELRGLI